MRRSLLLLLVPCALACKPAPFASPTSKTSRSAEISAMQRSSDARYAPRSVASGFALGAAHVGREGVRIPIGGRTLRVAFAGAGRSRITATRETEPRVVGARVELVRSASLVEWWTHGPLGLEVGLDLSARPEGEGALSFDFAIDGGFRPIVEGARVRLVDGSGATVASVRDLVVTDASGRELAARFVEAPGRLRIEVRDEGAIYPIRIDPIVGVETKLVSPAPGLYNQFGSGVAVSKGRVLVGEAEADPTGKPNAGLAYVYAPSTLAIEGTLSPTDGATDDRFGIAVAMDGDTALVGASVKDAYKGAAYVFVRGATGWTQQAKLVASDGLANDSFGASVAISGNVAIVGAVGATIGGTANTGAAYVFTRTGTTWSAGTKLTAPSTSAYGTSVAASGTTVAIGAVAENGSQGAVYLYTGSGASWPLQKKLTIATSTTPYFGFAVALDGDTLAASAFKETVGSVSEAGSAYVFTRTGTTWTQQARLTAATPASFTQFGYSVGLSGNVLAVGQPGGAAGLGAASVFLRSGSTWTRKTDVAGAVDKSAFGWSVGVDGDLAAFAAQTEDQPGKTGAGAVHVYMPLLAYANGTACSIDGVCASAHCVDGVCCDTTCTASCSACNLTGKVGACSPTDGAPVGARTCTPSKFCKAGACSSDCAAESDCVSGYFCDLASTPGTCKSKSGAGTCKDAKECATGFCVDGHCCDRACEGQCEACDVTGKEGTCAPVSGDPHAGKPKCDDGSGDLCKAKSCDGAKDATSCTTLKNVGVSCKTGACSGEDLIGASSCDDKGSCVAPAPSKCGKYTCDPAGPACRTSCAQQSDCAAGFTCLAGICSEGARCSDDRSTSIAKSGDSTPCAPFLCGADGSCASTCNSSSDCAPSAVCDVGSARCVAAEPTSDGGGCTYGGSGVTLTPAFLLMLLAAGTRRRRTR
ncbi:MAG: FG-GAP repeat protein [Polyangiales bacterium]